MTLRVLVVEDDREIRALLQSSLGVEGFDVRTAASLSEAFALLRHDPPDVVVLDLGLPDGDGAQLVAELRARRQSLKVLCISAYCVGADVDVPVLSKPFSRRELLSTVHDVLAA